MMENNNNVCIQCDKYTLNCCGNVTYYWDEFQKYYGINRNFSNWMNITVNNGSTPGDFPCSTWPFAKSADWSTLFKSADSYGINNLWLFAEGTGNKSAVLNYCRTAWKSEWLKRRGKKLIILWKLDDAGNNEKWPEGKWYVGDAYYSGKEELIDYSR